MSEMLFSNPSHLVLILSMISLISKDESILMKKNKNFTQKVAPYHLGTDPGPLVSDSPPFLPSMKKRYLFLLANKIDLVFFSCNKDEY